jgi:tetratricopeptide (TPR) repeat protein
MKRLIMILAIALIGTSMMAQKSERTNAFMYNKNGQYDKAREAIDKAVEHEKTRGDAKAWMYRGIIYLNIVFSEDYANIDDKALTKSLESFKKAKELDPEDKMKQAGEIDPRIEVISQQYFSEAVELFNAQEFNNASLNFKESYDVAKILNKVDTLALLNAGLAAVRGENFQVALDYYAMLTEIGFAEPDVYRNIAAAHRGLGNNEEMMKSIADGRDKFPNDTGLMLEEINAYLAIGQGAKVVDDLKELVVKDPENYSIFFVLGTIYGDETNKEMYSLEVASDYYEKAIKLNPEYYDAIYNLGALYINESNKLQIIANDLPLTATKEYEKITEDANVIIRKALPHLEKAFELQPENQETVQVLKSIYARFKMDDKLKKMNEL